MPESKTEARDIEDILGSDYKVVEGRYYTYIMQKTKVLLWTKWVVLAANPKPGYALHAEKTYRTHCPPNHPVVMTLQTSGYSFVFVSDAEWAEIAAHCRC